MPRLPKVVTDTLSRASGAEVELTPLTAVEPDENHVWRQRFQRQVNRNQAQAAARPQGEAASYYNPSSRFSPETSIELSRKVRVVQKKRFSKWRLIFMTIFVFSVLTNIAFITLFVYWYIKFKQICDIWNETFPIYGSTPTPTA